VPPKNLTAGMERDWEKLATTLETIKKRFLDDSGKREKIRQLFPVPLHAFDGPPFGAPSPRMRSAPFNITLGDSPTSGHQTDGAVAKKRVPHPGRSPFYLALR
jgi:hypothetical protein